MTTPRRFHGSTNGNAYARAECDGGRTIMGVIDDIYADLDADISEAAFREAVEDKVEEMAGLADEETAAMLIAHELTDQAVDSIAEIEPGMEEVKFRGKIVAVGDIREFDREDDDVGRVVNVEVADETGSIRAAFWDEMADSATTELEPGQVLRIQGRPREGYGGVEVSVEQAEIDEDAEIDVTVAETYRIDDLSIGLSDVTLRGKVLDSEPIRTFDRDDGSEGRVSNLVVGDETGRLRVTLWDRQAELADAFDPGESIEVIGGYVRERDGDLELHVGSRGSVERLEDDVPYEPDTTDIAEVEIGDTVDIAGVVRSADPKRTFDRDDGSEGQVRNIRVQDKTGDIRVALWGEKADREIVPGDEVQLAEVDIEDGWQDDLEASAGWQSTVTVFEEGPPEPGHDGSQSPRDSADTGLDAFTDPDPADAAAETPSDPIEFTGVVVQAGEPIILDDGDRAVRLDTGADVILGEELTVRGRLDDDQLTVEEIIGRG